MNANYILNSVRILLPSLEGGGSERVAVRLASEWSLVGLHTEIMVVRSGGVWDSIADQNIQIKRLCSTRVLRSIPKLIWHLNKSPLVPTIVFGFDLGVVVGVASKLGLINGPWIYREGSLPSQNISPKLRWLYRIGIANASYVVAQSRAAHDELNKLGVHHKRLVQIHNPMAGEIASRPVKDLSLVFGSIKIISVSRLSKEKGIDRLFKAYPAILSRLPGSSLVVYGEGPMRSEIEKEIKKVGLNPKTSLPGFEYDVYRSMSEASIFVLPSWYEGVPNSLMEAIGIGMPVIVADAGGGVREIMNFCGLKKWVLSQDLFDAQLPQTVVEAMQAPTCTWRKAAEILRKETRGSAIAEAYLNLAKLAAFKRVGSNRTCEG